MMSDVLVYGWLSSKYRSLQSDCSLKTPVIMLLMNINKTFNLSAFLFIYIIIVMYTMSSAYSFGSRNPMADTLAAAFIQHKTVHRVNTQPWTAECISLLRAVQLPLSILVIVNHFDIKNIIQHMGWWHVDTHDQILCFQFIFESMH